MGNSLWFTHDYTAADDVKILFLRQALGMEGYGIFWYIIEQLAKAGGTLPINIIPVLSMQMQTTDAKVVAVIKNFDLFTLNDDGFFSQRLNKSIELRQELSKAGAAGAAKRWAKEQPQLKLKG